MVKLIRLTSENNGKFNANMDSDIIVGEKASIAVQNLTFETIFEPITIGANNNVVKFNLDAATFPAGSSENLQNVVYNSLNYGDLFDDMERALNNGLLVNDGNIANEYSNYGAWYVESPDEEEADRVQFQFRLAPLLHPRVINRDFDPADPNNEDAKYPADDDEEKVFFQIAGEEEDVGRPRLELTDPGGASDILNFGGFKKPAGDAAAATRDAWCVPSGDAVKLCSGSGVFFARVGEITDNTGAQNTNGFALGLSYNKEIYGLADGEEIDNSYRDFEIMINRPTDNYISINPGTLPANTPVISSVTPFSTGATFADNDIMMIRKQGSQIIGSVVSKSPGFEYVNLPAGNDWTQAPAPATERFDETNLGDVATYRRTQEGSALEQWWEATSATAWNLYNTQPVVGQAPDNTATINVTTGVITIGASTFTPSSVPPTVTNGRNNVLFTYNIPIADQSKDLYPYFFVNGAATTTGINYVGVTLDPHRMELLATPTDDDSDDSGEPDDDFSYFAYGKPSLGNFFGGQRNPFEYSSADIQALLPALDQSQYTSPPFNIKPTITLDKSILRFCGFAGAQFQGSGSFTFTTPDTNFNSQFNIPYGYGIKANQSFQLINSDNYVVILDSNPVLSYDASVSRGLLKNDLEADKQGQRKNIIATIPINNNSQGIVEFRANELVYIDLDNKFPQNISNLRLRVLDKSLNEIKTAGTSVITLLLKDE